MSSTQRADKFLWFARFVKSRALAQDWVEGGKLRVNGQRIEKPAYALKIGDVLTFAQGSAVRVIRIEAFAERRGPASAAIKLYADLAPPEPKPDKGEATEIALEASTTRNPAPPQRPDARDRRALLRLRKGD